MHVFKRDLTMCSNFANHSRFNSEHTWEDRCDHLRGKKKINKFSL